MNNKKLIEIKYFGTTNTKGSRIKLTDVLRKKSKIINLSYEFNNTLDNAINYFIKKGIKKEDINFGELKDSYILIFDDFKIEL